MSNISADMAGGNHNAPAAWRTLAVLVVIYILHFVDRSVFSIVLEPVKREFALSDSELGLLTGIVYALTYAIAGIPLGFLVDRVSRKRLLSGILFIWSGATMMCGFAQSYGQLVVARFAVGAAEAGGAPASMSMISDLFPKSRRASALGIFWSSTAFAAAVTFILGGWAVQTWGWRSAFLLAGAPGIVMVVVLLMGVPEPKRGAMDEEEGDTADEGGKVEKEQEPKLMVAVRAALREPTVLPVFIAMTLTSVVASGTLVWAVSFLMRTQGLALTEAGLIAGLSAATFGIIGTLLGGRLADYFGQKAFSRAALVPAVASIVAVFAQLGLATAPSVLAAIITYAIFDMTFRMSLGPGYSLLLSPLVPEIRGLASSAMQVSTNLIGWGLGPLIVGTVSDYFVGDQSLRMGFVALALINIIAAMAYFAAWKKGSVAQKA